MKFKKILIEEVESSADKQKRLRDIQRIGRKYDVEVLEYKEDTGEFRVIGSAKNLSLFYAELEKEDIIHLEEGFRKETWEEVYKKFQNIIDQFFPNEDEIESRVYNLYMSHQGEEAYEIAYDKWLDSNKEDLDESLEDDLSKYIQYEDTSWIDDLRDSFSEFEHLLWNQPSLDKIMELHDGMWIPLLKEYFKNTSNSLQEGLYIKPTSKVVSGIDGAHLQVLDNNTIPHTTMSFKAEYISGDSIGNVFNFVLADDIGDAYIQSLGQDPMEVPTECFEIDGNDEGAFFILDVDINLNESLKESIEDKVDDIEFVIENYLHNQPYEFECLTPDGLTWEVCDYDKIVRLVFDPNWSEWVYTIDGKGPYSHNSYEYINSDLQAIFLSMPDPEDTSETLDEGKSSSVHNITIEGIEDREECPYLLGESNEEIEIPDRFDLDENELWVTGWIGAVQNEDAGPFTSFEELDIYCYDREKGKEYDLPEIPEDIKAKFLTEVNKYIEFINHFE